MIAFINIDLHLPFSHLHLLPHMSETLKTNHNPVIIQAIHKLISTSIKSSTASSFLIKHSYIADIGFKGVTDFFRPFPKVIQSIFY